MAKLSSAVESPTIETPSEQAQLESFAFARWIGFLAIAAVFLAGYWDLLVRLVDLWWSKPDYGHGFFVPIIAAAYLWIRRERLVAGYRRDQPVWVFGFGVGLIVLALIIRIVGILGRAMPVEGASLVPLAAGILVLLCGAQAFRYGWPACLVLLLMLPIPGGAMRPLRGKLQTVATNISVFSLQTMGLPAISRGNVITLPNAEIGVAEACSGLRMLVAFTALVSALTMFVERPIFEKAVLLLAIIPIAVVVNAWRVIMVAIATHFRPASADTVHDLAGLGMMILAMALLWSLLAIMGNLYEVDELEINRTVTS